MFFAKCIQSLPSLYTVFCFQRCEHDTEYIDMRRQDVMEVAGGQTVQIGCSMKTSTGLNFTRQGWHMVSLPVVPDNNRVDELFPNLLENCAYTWNPVEKNYEAVTHLQPGQGYWLPVENPALLQISGEAVDFFHLTLRAGWNIIGAPFDIGAVEADPQDALWYQFIEWDAANGSYRTTQQLLATRAYWVWAVGDCELIGYSKDISDRSDLNKSSQPLQQCTPPPPPHTGTGVEFETSQPRSFRVMQNYPNPFNPSTLLSYRLERDGYVEIAVFNLHGERIKTLERGFQRAGEHSVGWDGCDNENVSVASGLYLIRVHTRNHEKIIKAMRLR
ncbi:T9SS type A sorting domain-containing protein [candidate division KSB1 bacterium]|nr:T9SS type A sorting domain-containing protein [candidate division KSB1 bacterium]